MFLRHPLLSLATLGYLGLVGWITLVPQDGLLQNSIVWQIAELLSHEPGFEWFTFDRLEFLANVAMFAPLGLFFVLLLGRPRWWLAILLAIAVTFGIEFAQQFIAGRVSDPRDLVANSLGATLGTVAAMILTASKARRLRQTRRLPAQRTA